MNPNINQISVYLTARYSRREELCKYRAFLRQIGFRVDARWLDGNHQIDDAGLSAEAKQEERTRFAVMDEEDCRGADICIAFTESPAAGKGRGGRHVQFGIARADGKRLIVVGPRETIFHCLPGVEHYPDWQSAFDRLCTLPALSFPQAARKWALRHANSAAAGSARLGGDDSALSRAGVLYHMAHTGYGLQNEAAFEAYLSRAGDYDGGLDIYCGGWLEQTITDALGEIVRIQHGWGSE